MKRTKKNNSDQELESMVGSLFASTGVEETSSSSSKNESAPLHKLLRETPALVKTYNSIKKHALKVSISIVAAIAVFYAGKFVYSATSKALSEHVQESVLYTTEYLQQQIDNLEEDISKYKNQGHNNNVYVYDLQQAVLQSNIIQIKKDFEKNINSLNKEIDEAKRKIRSLKNSRVKKDFADLYLKSLTLKKDNMMKDHEKALQDATDRINAALAQIVKEKNIPAVFKADTIAYAAGNVIDITPEIVKILKQ